MEFSQLIFPWVTSIHSYFFLELFVSMSTVSHGLEEQVYSQEKQKLTRDLRKLEEYTDYNQKAKKTFVFGPGKCMDWL